MVPLPRIDFPAGPSIPPFPPWRARLDLRELIPEYKPEIVRLIILNVGKSVPKSE
jgi:hypothetical protein